MPQPPESPPPETTEPEAHPVRKPGRTLALGLRKAYSRVRRVAYGSAGLGMILVFAGKLLSEEIQSKTASTGFVLILLGFMLLLVGYVLFLAIKLKESA